MAIMAIFAVALSSCAAASMSFEDFNRSWNGISATITTYDQAGELIDKVHGTSVQVSLDTRFSTTSQNSDGTVTTTPGDVMLISVGTSHISHVGSTMIWAEDGVNAIAGADTTVDITNTKQGTPWINNLFEYSRNLWKGNAKTLLIRSQDGKPIAVYSANEVEVVGTAVPKSTMFRLDGKRLFVYRADYTMYDTILLKQ
ncbi:DUF5052 family protein [Microbacteriaceae bacterium]|nr:DUF5052 family protein [Candidatus Saccharibacteria bacterium]